MGWALLWVVLVLGALAVLGLLTRGLWRKVKTVTAELRLASERLAAVAQSSAEPSGPPDTWEAARTRRGPGHPNAPSRPR
ncbi:MAG: hypothetical protein QOI54_1858 [Actinomycetota bacterium]|jgi:FtsZ-interacting cell division protein ZipA|nr:hypothetical protein [Actinomycetota bacterium]